MKAVEVEEGEVGAGGFSKLHSYIVDSLIIAQ
jgi:hypothetical protein